MMIPFLLFALSAGYATWSWFQSGTLTDFALVAWVSALAAVIVAAREWLAGEDMPPPRPEGRVQRAPKPARAAGPKLARGPRPAAPRQEDLSDAVIVDGSNVLYWDGNRPALESLRLVLRQLEAQGLTPLVGFDANVGHLIAGRYLGPGDMAALLDLRAAQVAVAPRGSAADPLLIAEARRLEAPIVTNDRYRDWARKFPEIASPGFLIPGRIREGVLELGERLGGGMVRPA